MLKNSLWLRSLPLYLFALLLFLIPIEYKYDHFIHHYLHTLSVQQLLPKHTRIYFYISDVIALFVSIWILWRIRKKYTERGTLFLLFVFIWAALSIVFSQYSTVPIRYLHLIQLFTPITLFFFLAHNPFPPEKLFKIFCWTIFAVGLIQAGLAIAQYFTQQNIDLYFWGQSSLHATIHVPNGHRWIFDEFANRVASSKVYRAEGTMPHPNPLGGLLAISLFVTNYLFHFARQGRFWLSIAYFILLFALMVTFSRSAIFAYAIAIICWFSWIRFSQGSSIKSSALLILIATAIVGTLLHEQIINRGGIINYTTSSYDSDQTRLSDTVRAFQIIESHPFFGIGYAQNGFHNVYLMLASQIGLIGLFAFLGWIGWILRTAWQSTPRLPQTVFLIGIFIGFLFIGGCDWYPLYFQQGKLLFFAIAGLLARFSFQKTENEEVYAGID